MTKLTFDNQLLCLDCTMYVVNRDDSGNSEGWDKKALLDNLATFRYSPADVTEDFSTKECGGCGTALAGTRHEFEVEATKETQEKMKKKADQEVQYKATLHGAVEACLWSTIPSANDEESQDLVEPADSYEISSEEIGKLRGTISHHLSGWFLENYELLTQAVAEGFSWYRVGFDFWLSAEGHGSGFWDVGLGELGDNIDGTVTGYGDLVGLGLNEEGTHILVDPYNVTEFSVSLFNK